MSHIRATLFRHKAGQGFKESTGTTFASTIRGGVRKTFDDNI